MFENINHFQLSFVLVIIIIILLFLNIFDLILDHIFGTKYSRMDQVELMEDNL